MWIATFNNYSSRSHMSSRPAADSVRTADSETADPETAGLSDQLIALPSAAVSDSDGPAGLVTQERDSLNTVPI